jgi:hypothetical protein
MVFPASLASILGRATDVLNQYIRPLAEFVPQRIAFMTPETPISTQPRHRAARLARETHLPLAAALTLLLAFRAGGFFPAVTAVAAVVGAVALLLRMTLAHEPFVGWSRTAGLTALGAAGYASLVLLSGVWSDAPARAMIEFDRALLYLEVLVLYALAPRGPGTLAALLRWLLGAFVVICVAGLGSRLAPDVFPTSGRFVAERLAFPLTYWNAMGMASALTVLLALAQAAGRQESRASRALGSAVLPIAALALYLSFSRGAIAACAVGVIVFLVCVRTVAALLAVLAAGLPTAVALIAAYQASALGTAGYAAGGGPAQGHRVAAVLVVAVIAAAGLNLLAGRAAEWEPLRLRRFGPQARGEQIALAGALAIAVFAAGLWVDAPGRAERAVAQFRTGDVVPDTGDARDRLLQTGNNGRLAFWDVALATWADHRLLGRGAGTYQLEWEQRRPFFYVIRDGHSLVLETLAEVGVVGLMLLLAALLTPLALALRRGWDRRRPDRTAHAVVAAAGLALLFHACTDWDWEMPVLFVWFFAAAGVIVAAPADGARGHSPGRLARVICGLGCLLVAVTPWLVAGWDTALAAGDRAFDRGDCRTAIDDALTARDRLPIAPEPYELVGYCDLRAGDSALGVDAMREARERDPRNWRFAYGLAVAQAIAGQDPRPAARTAVRLNPREPLARDLARAMETDDPAKRFRAAARASLPPG